MAWDAILAGRAMRSIRVRALLLGVLLLALAAAHDVRAAGAAISCLDTFSSSPAALL
jgi:hypothetical protein